jgi:hypothetical protein
VSLIRHSDQSRDRNTPYLTILLEKKIAGAEHVHAGLARHGIGRPFCDEQRALFEFWIPARDPQFALYRPDGWRHRYAEAFLELNRGCQTCLATLYQIGNEVGWGKPKSLRT